MCLIEQEIEEMIEDLIRNSRRQRTIECQQNAYLSFTYFQGTIDALTDARENIRKIKLDLEDKKNHKEIQ